jgi:hypothetical protein
MSTTNNNTGRTADEPHTAGLFDIRNIIGGLLGIYGVILLVMGLFGDTEESKTGGVNANLWTGLVLLVVGLIFIAWAKMRPVEVDEEAAAEARSEENAPRMDTL